MVSCAECCECFNKMCGTVTEAAVATPPSDVKKGLEIALVVLVIFLIILGLIIGFNKLKNNDNDDPLGENGETYY